MRSISIDYNSGLEYGYHQALRDIEDAMKKASAKWKIFDYESYTKDKWITRLLKRLKKKMEKSK